MIKKIYRKENFVGEAPEDKVEIKLMPYEVKLSFKGINNQAITTVYAQTKRGAILEAYRKFGHKTIKKSEIIDSRQKKYPTMMAS